MSHDRKFDILHEVAESILGLRCIYPSTDRGDIFRKPCEQYSARCMLELSIETNSHGQKRANEFEDIVERVRVIHNGEEKAEILKILKYISVHLFGQSPIQEITTIDSSTKPLTHVTNTNPFYSIHPGLCKLMKMILTKDYSILLHTFSKHSLLSVSRYHASTTLSSGTISNTAGLGCKDLRLRFLIYQLLQAVNFIHSKGLCLHSLEPNQIMIDDEMWVYVSVGLSDRVFQAVRHQLQHNAGQLFTDSNKPQTEQKTGESTSLPSFPFQRSKSTSSSAVPRPVDYYEPFTIQWINGKISNFEYLMAINTAVGRTMMDPLYHPILPWVTDFTTNCLNALEFPSFRDLTKTKFRLSKGDTQLETTYRHSDPPHHIPESLSELTYYIYLARMTPMQVLRRVVRDVFVPEHYPSSMHRIYEWTPDECIPEFYLNPHVFESIHKDSGLEALELPPFAPTPADFIAYHRAVLESDMVSNQLHYWIDLTFGYCLYGQAALDNMNVPLSHTLTISEKQGLDTPNVNKHPGFVMLFEIPHPPRQVNNPKTLVHMYDYPYAKRNLAQSTPSTTARSNNTVGRVTSSNKLADANNTVTSSGGKDSMSSFELANKLGLLNSTMLSGFHAKAADSDDDDEDIKDMKVAEDTNNLMIHQDEKYIPNSMKEFYKLNPLYSFHHSNKFCPPPIPSTNEKSVSSSVVLADRAREDMNNDDEDAEPIELLQDDLYSYEHLLKLDLTSYGSMNATSGSGNPTAAAVTNIGTNQPSGGTRATPAVFAATTATVIAEEGSGNAGSGGIAGSNITNAVFSDNTGSMPGAVGGSGGGSGNPSNLNASMKKTKKSLIRGLGDSTWMRLKQADSIDLSSTSFCHDQLSNLRTQFYHCKFANKCNSNVYATYQLPSITNYQSKRQDRKTKPSTADSTAEGKNTKEENSNSGGNTGNRKYKGSLFDDYVNNSNIFWDEEFQQSVNASEELMFSYLPNTETISNKEEETTEECGDVEGLNIVERLQGEDMFAIGCMIAELYSSRSLLDPNDALTIEHAHPFSMHTTTTTSTTSASASRNMNISGNTSTVNASNTNTTTTTTSTTTTTTSTTTTTTTTTSATKEDDDPLQLLYRKFPSVLPLVIKRLIGILCQASHLTRPSAQEILLAATILNQENHLKQNHISQVMQHEEKMTAATNPQNDFEKDSDATPSDLNSGFSTPFRTTNANSPIPFSGKSISNQSLNAFLDPDMPISEADIPIPPESSFFGGKDSENDNNPNKGATNDPIRESTRFIRIELLADYCNTLFPDYFPKIYAIIGAMKLATNSMKKLQILLSKLDELLSLPLDGWNILLIHIFHVLHDVSPYHIYETISAQYHTSSSRTQFPPSTHVPLAPQELHSTIGNYYQLIDVMGIRLGPDIMERLVVPQIVKFLTGFPINTYLITLMQSPIWNVLILRTSDKCFLKNFFPLLLTYLTSGTLKNILLRRSLQQNPYTLMTTTTVNTPGNNNNNSHKSASSSKLLYPLYTQLDNQTNIPLWALPDAKDRVEWLRYTTSQTIDLLQKQAVKCIANLSNTESLGGGITTRYIVPSLLSLIGIPQLAISSFDVEDLHNGIPAVPPPSSSTTSTTTTTGSLNSSNHMTSGSTHGTSSNEGQGSINTAANTQAQMHAYEEWLIESNILVRYPVESTATPASALSSSTAANLTNATTTLVINKHALESLIHVKSLFNVEHMYLVKCVVELGTRLGDQVISELILSHIINISLPDLLSSLNPIPKPGIIAALFEIIILLNGLLPILNADTIVTALLIPSKLTGSSLPKLLSIWPLIPAFTFLDEPSINGTGAAVGASTTSTASTATATSATTATDSHTTPPPTTATDADTAENATPPVTIHPIPITPTPVTGQHVIAYIENVRLHLVLLELCRLIVSISMIAGLEACCDYVLPHVDTFFKNFVATYGVFPIESKMLYKAFELGAELYLPLVQLVGPETFYTAVSNLNPRLELWLRCIGSSNVPATSPPLPSNIWPEITTEVNPPPEKKKGIMHWISNKSKWLTSSSYSNSTTSAANAASHQHRASMMETATSAYRAGQNNTAVFNSATTTNSSSTQYAGALSAATLPDQEMKSIHHATINTLGINSMVDDDDEETHVSTSISSSIPSSHRTSQVDASIRTPQPRKNTTASTPDDGGSRNGGRLVNRDSPAEGSSSSDDEGQRAHRGAISGAHASRLRAVSNDRDVLDSDDDSDTAIDIVQRRDEEEEEDENFDGEEEEGTIGESIPDTPGGGGEVLNAHEEEERPGSEVEDAVEGEGRILSLNSVTLESNTSSTENDIGAVTQATPQKSNVIDHTNTLHLPATELKQFIFTSHHPHLVTTPLHPNHHHHHHNTPTKGSANAQAASMELPYLHYHKLINKNMKKHTNHGRHSLSDRSSHSHRSSVSAMPARTMSMSGGVTGSAIRRPSLGHHINNTNTSPGGGSADVTNDHLEEVESKEYKYSEMAWFLAGQGRWNIEKEFKDRIQHKPFASSSTTSSTNTTGASFKVNTKPSIYYTSNNEWNPAASMSMSIPKIHCDLTPDLNNLFDLSMQSMTQWKIEENPGLIRCMTVNHTESLLLTCSRTAVRLWSLTTHPLTHISSYTNHILPPFSANFLRNGLHAVTNDGSIHLWDIETRIPLSILTSTEKLYQYTSSTVISSKYGIHPSIDGTGDEQIVATLQDAVLFYDIRQNTQRPTHKVAEFVVPPIPPVQSNFMSNNTIEPVVLTSVCCQEHYIYTGSQSGGLYVLDRRMGKVLFSWQGCDAAIQKIYGLDEKHILAVSDRSATVWEYNSEIITPSAISLPANHHYTSNTNTSASHHHSGAYLPQSQYHDGTATNIPTDIHAPSIPHALPNPYHHAAHTTHHNTLAYYHENPYTITPSLYHLGLGSIGDIRKLFHMKSTASDMIFTPSNMILSSFDCPNQWNAGNVSVADKFPAFGKFGGPEYATAISSGLSSPNASGGGGSGGLGSGGNAGLGSSSHGVNNPNGVNSNTLLRPHFFLYALSGHKLYSSFLPSFDHAHNRERLTYLREMGEYDEIKLNTHYMYDRKGSKLSKSKMQVTSAVMLPLRRLLLLGTEDGMIRVIS